MNTNSLTKEKIDIILEPLAQDLADMRAKGKPISELLYWIRTTKGWVINPAQLERFLKQKASTSQAPAEAIAKAEDEAGLEYRQLMSPATATPSTTPDNSPPIAHGGLTTPARSRSAVATDDLAGLMDKFRQVLSRVMDQSDDQPATLKVIDKMMQTVIDFEHGKERLAQNRRSLQIKEENHQRKVNQPKINNHCLVGDDVRRLIPENPHAKNDQTAPDHPNPCPDEILPPPEARSRRSASSTPGNTPPTASPPSDLGGKKADWITPIASTNLFQPPLTTTEEPLHPHPADDNQR